MRFLLCGINAKYIHSNLAVHSLAAYARREHIEGADIQIREYTINHYVEDILQDLYETQADVFIFSCYIWNISFVRELAPELKKVRPACEIWVGGPEVSYDSARFLLENPAVDLVMRGEGEAVFSQLVRLWMEGFSLEKLGAISGIAVREIDTGFAPLLPMDEVPFVYEDFSAFANKILYYETSRGCPFCCSYCLSSVEEPVRLRSLSLVLGELQRFLDARVPQVKFVDRTFNCDRRRALAIWSYLNEHDNGITNFHFEIAADLLGEEELALFRTMRPGLIQLEIGVQSTHAPTIAAIHRHMDLEKLFSNVDRVHAMGNIHQHLDLIAGLPFETYEQFGHSFDDLYAHAPDQLQLGFLKVLKGTVMEAEAARYDIVYRSRSPYEVLGTRWLSYEEIIRLKGVEALTEMYYNSGQYAATLAYVVPFFASPFRFFEAFSSQYRERGYHRVNHSRMEKYEILRTFLREKLPEAVCAVADNFLLYDLYLRERVKGRPAWAPDNSAYKKEWKTLYQTSGARLFAEEFQAGTYDGRWAANHSHIERFGVDIETFLREGVLREGLYVCLFDYTRRNPLDRSARTVWWRDENASLT